ncbi:MAG: 1-acyl-sn-glycerol-3-phosphate acyltransferase [Sandaracinaceae bacterium]|nr:1-acyl-sn-glycerol-3-phosphate acyltransferase [Sandaracinaceae bacterium]
MSASLLRARRFAPLFWAELLGVRDHVVRLAVAALVRVVYRVRSEGIDHVPEHGPAIVVANHVSYADALVLGALCRRPVRFVMDHRIYASPALRWFFRLTRAIPIAPRKEDSGALERAFAEIERALDEGEVIGLFPEGKLTRDGEVDVFRPGIERILLSRPVPVVPVALRGFWGSFFSYRDGKPMRKLPSRVWSRIEVVAGRALAPAQASAQALRARVIALRGAIR